MTSSPSKSDSDPVGVVVTFIKYKKEIIGVFRAIWSPDKRAWVRETPYATGTADCLRTVLPAYAHYGQHCEISADIVRYAKRANAAEYSPLWVEMVSRGYNIYPHQSGRLALAKLGRPRKRRS